MQKSLKYLLLLLFIMGCSYLLLPFFTAPSDEVSVQPDAVKPISVEQVLVDQVVAQVLNYDKFPTKYDEEICDASKLYLPIPTFIFGCTLYKAQLYQESLLDPNARSTAGAEGLAQIMPKTWEAVLQKMRIGAAERTDASVSIMAGAFYMSDLRSRWIRERGEKERIELAQASYNAGFGNLLKAQRICRNALNWDQIKVCMPQVTGVKNTHETTTYIERIWGYWTLWLIPS